MKHVEFSAPEYQADGSFRTTRYAFEGGPKEGWTITREGETHLALGPGYRLLESVSCGICSTDLARRFLPFPLPQVIGHEVLACDESGQRYVVEINASHAARGLGERCPFCAAGLGTHCPERKVLGIHDLPGGFGRWLLAPVEAVIPVPDEISARGAVLVEPLAAALHAVTTVQPRDGETVAVLGPRRLGLLVVAALAAYRDLRGLDVKVAAFARRPALAALSRALGADDTTLVEGDGGNLRDGLVDVVIDTTGTPAGLDLAIRLARREVHLKSTHGQPAGGLRHLTEAVVDELSIAAFTPEATAGQRVAWLADDEPPVGLPAAELICGDAAAVQAAIEAAPLDGRLPRADVAVVDRPELIDAAIRPRADREQPVVKPRGTILLTDGPASAGASSLADAVLVRGLRLSSSRCGDFHTALSLMTANPDLVALEERLVTHRYPATRLAEAFATAVSPDAVKVVVDQEPGA